MTEVRVIKSNHKERLIRWNIMKVNSKAGVFRLLIVKLDNSKGERWITKSLRFVRRQQKPFNNIFNILYFRSQYCQ